MWSVAGIPEFAEGTTSATFAGNHDLSFHNHITYDGDTSWFVYDDSAQGRIHWIHAFHDADGNTHNLVRDSLVFRWPFAPAAPVLTASFSRRLNWYGYELCEGLADGDGDGSLNGSAPGTALRQRKEFTVTLGDTAWKSVWLMGHGGSDAAGDGLPVMFADSMFVKGAAVAGTRGSDGDGDGFVFSGPAGAPMVVRTESFHRDAGGLRIHTRGASGPGEDGDFFISGDNPLYPFTVAVLSASGDTLSVHAYGDADADGYYADPRAGAANRVWETGRYLEREGFRTYRDSLVKSLGALETRPMMAWPFTGSHTVGVDGAETRRKDVFGPAQSDWTWEERRYAADGDSTVTSGSLGPDGVFHYADLLPRGARASGWYETETGRFRDTLALEGRGMGDGHVREFCDGIHHASAGTADFALNARPADGGGTWTRMLMEPDDGGGFAVTAIRGPDRDTYRIRGDTVTWKASYGDTLAAFTAIPLGTGGYRVLESVIDGGGGPLAEAEFEFGPDRSGRGSYRDMADGPSGRSEAAVEFVFGAEGSVRRLEAKGIGEVSGE